MRVVLEETRAALEEAAGITKPKLAGIDGTAKRQSRPRGKLSSVKRRAS